MVKFRSGFLPLLALSIPWFVACQPETPVARVQIEPVEVTLTFPQTVVLDLRWSLQAPVQPADGRLLVFVHLIDAEGKLERTFDHPFPEPWSVGEEITYPLELYQSAVDPALPIGTYRLTLGLYDATGKRWPLETGGQEVDDYEYSVARVVAPDARRSTPKFTFSKAWTPPEATGHRQLLAHRWLTNQHADLVVWGIEHPGEVVLRFKIPEQRQRGSEPMVDLRSKCAEFRGQVSGQGTHEIRSTIRPDATGDRCSIRFVPNFSFRDSARTGRYSALLEKATWSPL